jgi:transposase-like protein
MAKQQKPKMQKFTISDFNAMFTDDATCLEWLKNHLYPNGIHCEMCGRVTKHHRVASRPSYSCDHCGHHVHPTAGTIYHKSTTPLRLWFYAVYLMASTRCGISAKQIQRETGVTYKTAWRMFKQIRSMLTDDDGDPLSGEVEADETFVGGKAKNMHKKKREQKIQGRGTVGKTVVAGVLERGGRVVAKKVADTQAATLLPFVREKILPASTVYTDEAAAYGGLPQQGYQHHRVHHASGVYVIGDVHTNTIEGFWSLIKNGIPGVYHAVSDKYLQTYLDEFAFRYNRRNDERPMYLSFLDQIQKADAKESSGSPSSEQPQNPAA